MIQKIAHRMTLTLVSDREISVTRAFDAPRILVFEAWSNCEHMKNWWGPRGFDLIECSMDLRPGGRYRFVQRAPDGSIHGFNGVYREIAAPERIVFTQIYEPIADQEVVVTTTLTETDGRTALSQNLLFGSKEARDGMIASGMERGEAESFDRLDELLAGLRGGGAAVSAASAARTAGGPAAAGTASAQLVVTREFDAPRDLVWKAWTEPDRLARWWGPKGSEIRVARLDLRPGGVFHYSMKTPNGPLMWGLFAYREVVPTERIVFVNSFSDAAGGLTRNPWIATWPLEILNTLTLTEHGGKTTLTLRGGPINATAEELQAFEAGRAGMQGGFAGTFDKLDRYLAEALARA
jgi:uncharacterized protein YndB with AHSA1/START domain